MERALDRLWSDAVAGDKGDRSAEIRNWLQARDIAAVIPKRDDEMPPNDDDREKYRERPVLEQTIDRLKRFRRIATRFEKRVIHYLAMATIAMILEWL